MIRPAWSSPVGWQGILACSRSYAPDRAGQNAERILTGFDGILQLDGYQGYNRLTRPTRKGGDPITVAHCWAHARRKLKEVFDRDGSGIADEGLRRIAEFYRIEAEIRGMGPGQRLSARKARSAPLVAEFGDWLQAQRPRISSKSRLGEKLAYIHHHWDGLQTFLHDGRVEIDSNCVENLIRPIALTRKNALFAPSQRLQTIACRAMGSRRRRTLLGPHRLPHRNRKDQQRGAIRLSQGHSGSHRRRTSSKPDRRTASLELQAVKLKPPWHAAAAYGSVNTGDIDRLCVHLISGGSQVSNNGTDIGIIASVSDDDMVCPD